MDDPLKIDFGPGGVLYAEEPPAVSGRGPVITDLWPVHSLHRTVLLGLRFVLVGTAKVMSFFLLVGVFSPNF